MLQGYYALSCGAFLTLDNFKLDLLAVGERAEALAANGAMVDEDVVAAFALDKTEALGVVKPFDGSSRHIFLHSQADFPKFVQRSQATKTWLFNL